MKRAMALATMVECNKESNGFGGKCDGNEGGRRLMATRAMATVTATTWLMATVTRLAGDEEGKGEGGKGDGDGRRGGGGSTKARRRRQFGGGEAMAAARQRDIAWRRCGGGGSVSGGGGSATARRRRQLGGGAKQ